MLGMMYASQETEPEFEVPRVPRTRQPEERWSDADADADYYAETRRRRAAESIYGDSSYRPIHWSDNYHGQALLAVWEDLSAQGIEQNEEESTRDLEICHIEGVTFDRLALKQQLRVAVEEMRVKFPPLAYGEVHLETKWVEFVLGREEVYPFDMQIWKEVLSLKY